MNMVKNIMIVGVGGQGALLASKTLGQVLLDAGYDVKVSEVHGMSQRGGSVVTYVRYGDKVYSPIIDKGEADFIVSFEMLEAARYVDYLKKDGQIVVNTQQIDPMPVITGAAKYPENLEKTMQERTLSEKAAREFAQYACLMQLYSDFPDAKIAARSAEESWQNGVLTCTMHFTFRANIAVRAGAS